MPFLSVSFEVGAGDVETITEALLEVGALAVQVEDAAADSDAEEPLFAEGGLMEGSWRRSLIRALVAHDADARTLVEEVCQRIGIAPPSCAVELVADRDWVRATQAQFTSIRISPRLWIVPTWEAAPAPDAVNIILDPGLAFGTGSHPTTRMCLSWLERTIQGGESVIDYGCGSGILAIAAMKLGAGSALGIDIDEQALLAARSNAIQNRVRVEFRPAADRMGRTANIVVANILSRPLLVLAPLLAALTASRGRLALAGILRSQGAEVRGAYSEWFDMGTESEFENWVLLTGVKK
jgi:ribosomal protein L11 methyltransferase